MERENEDLRRQSEVKRETDARKNFDFDEFGFRFERENFEF